MALFWIHSGPLWHHSCAVFWRRYLNFDSPLLFLFLTNYKRSSCQSKGDKDFTVGVNILQDVIVHPCTNMKAIITWTRNYIAPFYVDHAEVIKWKYFPRYGPFVRGIHRSPVNSPHKGHWRGALMFSLICALNKRLSKQSWGWSFETPSSSVMVITRPCPNLNVGTSVAKADFQKSHWTVEFLSGVQTSKHETPLAPSILVSIQARPMIPPLGVTVPQWVNA